MATISVTIPDAILPRVIVAMAYSNGYADTIMDMDGHISPNPITKSQWAKNVIKDFIKSNVIAYEAAQASQIARDTALLKAANEITIGD